MRKAEIYYQNTLAGILEETDAGYRFVYAVQYLQQTGRMPISLTLPLSATAYESKVLFPFFDGLIPEGWLLDVALRNTDVSVLDRMGLLLLCCKDCIGAISVIDVSN